MTLNRLLINIFKIWIKNPDIRKKDVRIYVFKNMTGLVDYICDIDTVLSEKNQLTVMLNDKEKTPSIPVIRTNIKYNYSNINNNGKF